MNKFGIMRKLMNAKILIRKPSLIIILLILGALACSLTAEPPPTLPPRTPQVQATLTPQNPLVPQQPVVTTDVKGGLDNNLGPTSPPPALPTSVAVITFDSPNMTSELQQVDPNRLYNTVTALVRFQNRHTLGLPNPDTGIFAARDFLMAQLYQIQVDNPQSRISIESQPYTFPYAGQSYTAENPVMIINGTDPTAGIVIIGAHYDTVNANAITNAYLDQPGANDNASGVAAVLEIARILAQRPHRASIILIFFSGEEFGRYGSLAYIEDYLVRFGMTQNVRAMINLDTIGSSSGPNGTFVNNAIRVYSAPPNESPSRQLARLAEFTVRYFLTDIRVTVENQLDRAGRWGDHQSFSDAGMPAIRLIEYAEEANKFHNTLDNLDEIDPDYLRRTTQVALSLALVLADGPNPPTDIRIDTSQSPWRIEWTPSAGATRYVVALRKSDSLTFQQELIAPTNSFAHSVLQSFDVVAVAAIDANNQVGPFSAEVYLPASVAAAN
ncbi:MAG: hypothetical protein CUN55_14245 [Phototrophicales bacterium]|nr:MAG: hypothetical protein CUN55_14245 [Phototrophicales bacterium]